VPVRRFRFLQGDLPFGLALDCRIERGDTHELILRSLKFKWRPLHPRGKSGELHLPIGVGARFEIELPHSAKTILDMNLDRSCVNGSPACAQYCKFEGTGTSASLDHGNFFVGRCRLSSRK
jgi:hypothetical protein